MIIPFLKHEGAHAAPRLHHPSVLDLIGNTPLVYVRNLDTGPCELFLKLESHNPGGSIKDRIALAMVEVAEQQGLVAPGATLVEATAGNTGLGLALIAAQKGYKLILVIPDKMSEEKVFHLKAMGASVIMTRSDVTRGHPDYYHDKARAIAQSIPGAFYVNQFENPANPAVHESTTGPEIWRQMHGHVDAVVCGVGSGGTLSGLGRFFQKASPQTEMVLADPKGSILAPLVQTGTVVTPGSWLVEGIGEDFVPANCDLDLVKHAYTITDSESVHTAQEVLSREGILCGSSSGTLIAAALKYCRAQKNPKRVVTFVADSGNKYLSKIYNPYWLNDNDLVDNGPPANDLRDLIARPYRTGDTIWVSPGETLKSVHVKMTTFDISQVPVIQDDKIIGLIDEADVLMTVMNNPGGFMAHAGQVMSNKLARIDAGAQISDLLPVFEKGYVAAISDNDRFLGLVTPIDFLNHLRKRTGKA